MDKFHPIIEKLISARHLSEGESYEIMQEILSGRLPEIQMASILTALRVQGESRDEIVGFVRAMRDHMSIVSSESPTIADTCGTGGDGKGTFNISTAAAFVVAGAGIPVAKHGNRSVSSRCGSADVLETLGIKIDMPKKTAERCLREIGITFLFAPFYHPSMKNVAPVRKTLGIRTVFNILGPLVNPAGANVQVIGVAKRELVPLMASVLQKLGKGRNQSAVILHEMGHDELVLTGKCTAIEILDGKARSFLLGPKDFKIAKTNPDSLIGKDAGQNAQTLIEVLSRPSHPLQNVVAANASLALYCSGNLVAQKKKRARSLALRDAFERARESLLSGNALKKLNQLIEWSHKTS